jgi:type I restriction enzyme S subunit
MSPATTHIKIEKQLAPQLRFKEFDGEWEKDILKTRIDSIDSGWSPQCEEYPALNEEWGVLKTTAVVWEGFNQNANKKLPEKLEPRPNLQVVKEDILITRAGPTSRVGVTVYVNEVRSKLMLSDKLIRLKVNYITSSLFLSISLGNRDAQKQLVSKSSGLAESQTNISQKILLNTKLLFPKLPEQKKIASFLSAVDEKIQQLTKKKALLEQYKKGVMQQLFSGQLRFKDENGKAYPDWEEKRLGGIVEIMTDFVAAGSFESLRNNVTVYDELNHALYVRLTDLRHGLKHKSLKYVDKSSFEFLAKSNLYGGELLLANIGANVGDVYLMPFNIGHATIAPNMIVIRENINKFHSTYLFYHLNSHGGKKEINKAISGSGQPKLSKTDFKKLKLKLPSLFEQQKIATYLSGIDTKIESVNTKITQTQTFKKGLLQQLFV